MKHTIKVSNSKKLHRNSPFIVILSRNIFVAVWFEDDAVIIILITLKSRSALPKHFPLERKIAKSSYIPKVLIRSTMAWPSQKQQGQIIGFEILTIPSLLRMLFVTKAKDRISNVSHTKSVKFGTLNIHTRKLANFRLLKTIENGAPLYCFDLKNSKGMSC